jgi:CrcB protein
MTAIAVALAGGIGAALRLIVDGLIRGHSSGRFPWATGIINVTGALALGFVTGMSIAGGVHAVIGTGLLGGYTTFSTASFETARLAHDGRYRAALGNGLGMLIAAVAAASLGVWLGSLN